ncbi:hypothetical protein CLHUN_28600 [Ruminiclostridium hungatei]|uniref:YdhG-like domain-containing protein n=1 Tax=Ruminiclostridium hungatei TaxID=48256 RepID=A0A1V4SHA4_RUMHU|nr:DUF1801 domain-containing protein [Ruminiclostridium hungatei]OPX43312.1 hypothetical protein CLHUN_28600 [Ruminiclostridium hungatei]
MNQDLQEYINTYGADIQNLFTELRKLIFQSVSTEIDKELWAKLPSFYVGKNFIRIIPFKDHINIEASAIMEHKKELDNFKLTPRGMLQLYAHQAIPYNVLQTILKKTLAG